MNGRLTADELAAIRADVAAAQEHTLRHHWAVQEAAQLLAHIDALTERLAAAETRAGELSRLLTPYCRRVAIVGSVRRKRPDVKDLELLLDPLTVSGLDLFGEVVRETVPLYAVLDDLLGDGTLQLRRDKRGTGRWGDRYRAAIYRGHAVDLFIRRDPAQWGVLMAIRTGPQEFSRRLVTQRRFGGYLPDGWRVCDGGIEDDQGTLRETREETDVFDLLELPWIEPEARA